MLLESTRLLNPEGDHQALENVLLALSRSSRDTDTRGWYKEGSTIGVIFTELGADVDGRVVADALLTKVTKALTSTLTISQINEIRLTFHVFPENWDKRHAVDGTESSLYDNLLHDSTPKRVPRLLKRMMDVVGSALALVFCLPLFIGHCGCHQTDVQRTCLLLSAKARAIRQKVRLPKVSVHVRQQRRDNPP